MFDVGGVIGSLERQDDTTHVVSMWSTPGGPSYVDAVAIHVFFPEENAARIFTQKWEAIPELATMLPIDKHNAIMVQLEAMKARRKAA